MLWMSPSLPLLRPFAIAHPTVGEAHHSYVIGIQTEAGYYPCPSFEAVSGRNHSQTWASFLQ
jgi:hypothetical protein